MIDFKRGHTKVVGRTRQGKTYTITRLLQRERGGVLFFNTSIENLPNGYTRADGSNDIDLLVDALQDGEKINFIPSKNHTVAELQLAAIVVRIFETESAAELFVVVDESWQYRGKALKAMAMVARRGLRWNRHLIVLDQRLASMDNDIMTQCEQMVVFALNDERQYFQRYSYPYDEFMRRIEQKGKYSYCVYVDARVEGAFKFSG